MSDRIIEKIGKINLDLTLYSGDDRYCDGDIEDKLLEITRDYATIEYPRIIEESRNWPVLYHLSSLRENIVEWLPITKDMKVLEVGSGCGAITGALAAKCGELTCIDLSKKRSMINAYRHMELDNVTIRVGNFMDIEAELDTDYDYICLIGVFEYGQLYTGGEHPFHDLLKLIRRHCKRTGHIAIAIESKFGLKYWAGCKEDHLGDYFAGLEDYPEGGPVRTFTADGLIQIAKDCGETSYKMYYPYPDYKFMTDLYSDNRLPRIGELKNNDRNFDRDRIKLFDEKKVFDTIIREKQFPLFSNSYMLILGPQSDIDYVRYSNDRCDSCMIKTVERVENGQRIIEKRALSNEGVAHVKRIQQAYRLLNKRYDGSELQINRCELTEDGKCIRLEYIQGVTLEQLMDECLAKDDEEGFQRLFDRYLELIDYGKEVPVTDYDLIFSNILIDCHGKWTVIDYEWTLPERRETKEIAFRAIYCYIMEDEKRNKLNLDLTISKLDIKPAEAEAYRRNEAAFQQEVTGKQMSMSQIREAIGNKVYTIEALSQDNQRELLKKRVQIYEDTGHGFSEEESYFLDGADQLIRIPKGRKAVRIDPCSDYCIVYIKEFRWNGQPISLKSKDVEVNGYAMGEGCYVFDTQDPNITLHLTTAEEQLRENELLFVFEVTSIPEDTATHMKAKKKFWL